MKIAINKCYGGFGISSLAVKRLVEIGSPIATKVDWKLGRLEKCEEPLGDGWFGARWGYAKSPDGDVYFYSRDNDIASRSHPDLIRVIEELGEKAASARFGELKIVEVPDGADLYIDEYDGIETIHQNHETWG